ncbi:MAG: hypothetical protein JSC189_000650 [Candidatus Tokpelaia sp. JSC189]|nr:MAG: hypothetical protein JSC189_000650 [Candidatus Tokpelaia sp. JSC189]
MTQTKAFFFIVFAMCVVVTVSNILVQYPFCFFGLEHVLTYGAFIYPFAFLINDLTNRRFGQEMARRVVYVGFFAGLVASWWLASPRFAIASGSAFLFSQLLNIAVFTPLQRKSWWKAPFAAAAIGSFFDTVLFFSIAFAALFGFIDVMASRPDQSIFDYIEIFSLPVPLWLSLGVGDFLVKITMALFMLIPYGVIFVFFMPIVHIPQKSNASSCEE